MIQIHQHLLSIPSPRQAMEVTKVEKIEIGFKVKLIT